MRVSAIITSSMADQPVSARSTDTALFGWFSYAYAWRFS
jgi:hypothetical protein